jgi:hypothetical protein
MGDSLVVPDTFFHFVDISDAVRKQWTEDTLLRDRIYFRHRDQLNDPSELRPSFILEGTREQMLRYIKRIREFDPRQLSPANRLLEEKRLLQRILRAPQMPEKQLHELLGGVGLFCVTESFSNLLMWAHYANGHRGIAIGFDSGQGLFATAQPVTYSDSSPVINRLKDDWALMADKSMLWKSKAWEYEKEWRVVARFKDVVRQEQYIEQHHPPESAYGFLRSQDGPGHYVIPKSSVNKIVLGARTSADDEAWLRAVLHQRAEPVEIIRAVLSQGSVTASS